MRSILLAVALNTIGSSTTAEDAAWTCYSDEGALFDVVMDNGGARLNNFHLSERELLGIPMLYLTVSGVNRTEATVPVSVEIFGKSAESEEPLFVVSATPIFGYLSAGGSEQFTSAVFAPRGTLDRVDEICIAVSGATAH